MKFSNLKESFERWISQFAFHGEPMKVAFVRETAGGSLLFNFRGQDEGKVGEHAIGLRYISFFDDAKDLDPIGIRKISLSSPPFNCNPAQDMAFAFTLGIIEKIFLGDEVKEVDKSGNRVFLLTSGEATPKQIDISLTTIKLIHEILSRDDWPSHQSSTERLRSEKQRLDALLCDAINLPILGQILLSWVNSKEFCRVDQKALKAKLPSPAVLGVFLDALKEDEIWDFSQPPHDSESSLDALHSIGFVLQDLAPYFAIKD